MVSQKLNQQKLEAYFSASSNPTYDVAAHMDSQSNHGVARPADHTGGTSTPRDLNTRLKLLELYTLHVLPQNAEWDYARDFIGMSEVLDEERRDAFLHALQTLKEEKDYDAIREKELRKRQEQEMQQRRDEEERQRTHDMKQEEERKRRDMEEKARLPRPQSSASTRAVERGTSASLPSKRQPDGSGQGKKTPTSKGRSPSKKPPPPPPQGLYRRATSMFSLMQHTIVNAQKSLVSNPMAMLRFLLFLLAFALAFGRRDVRERIKRILNDSWARVRRTIGMGVKVSYI